MTTELDQWKVFHAVGAVVAEVLSDRELSVIAIGSGRGVDFKNGHRFVVDLGLVQGVADWEDVKFDKQMTIGSRNPHDQLRGNFFGSVYLERAVYNELPQEVTSQWPPPGHPMGMFTSIVYSENGDFPEERYHGFVVKLIACGPDVPVGWDLLVRRGVNGPNIAVKFGSKQCLEYPPWCPENPPGSTLPPILNGDNASSLCNKECVLFMETGYAVNTFQLHDPKLPVGLGGGYSPDSPTEDQGRFSQPHPNGPRISVSPSLSDLVLAEVLDRIDREARVSQMLDDTAALPGVVVKKLQGVDGPVIDLIAHASEGFLQFGGWRIEGSDATSRRLCEVLCSYQPAALRLLGCMTSRAPQVLHELRKWLQMYQTGQRDTRVYGSADVLFAMDFGPGGFLRDDLLVEASALPQVAPKPGAPPSTYHSSRVDLARDPAEAWAARFVRCHGNIPVASLRTETRKEAEVASLRPVTEVPPNAIGGDTIQSLIPTSSGGAGGDGDLYHAPGLLALPQAERLYRAGTRRPGDSKAELVFHRATIFLDGTFVRVYPKTHPRGVLIHRKGTRSLSPAY